MSVATPSLQAEREALIARMEANGCLDPACVTCRESFYPFYRTTWQPGTYASPPGPVHKPNPLCRSGKRPHCSCPACWG